MESALEDIEFLALSANRVEVLDAVSSQPHTRRELEERTGASQPTLGRILHDFEDRNWVEQSGREYAATPTGRLVGAGFSDLREIVETEQRLRRVANWLPTETMTFDLRRLRDATITTPTQTRPNAPVQRVLELLRDAERVEIVSHAFNEQSMDVVRRRVDDGQQTFEGVFSASAIDAIADDSTLRERLRELLDLPGADLRIVDDEVPVAVTVADDVVHLFLRDDDGLLQASVDTDDETVVSWAHDVHERYWNAARALDAADLDD
ncbi:IclR family transcriptional regulator [Haloprofundus marisrubri]|uniref:IclR family transcriptional regulator n=1 Tax=Haloprofundus marisrubri TaxID=1514971 RepID=A0A0W1RDH8_9EURY|nr:transcriptional regulator FilR1 domain-containing protein [Haloprofundus marisrubri]KTG11179.1 IclR family transcriptional regulator [Haloprofundus marisrubri]